MFIMRLLLLACRPWLPHCVLTWPFLRTCTHRERERDLQKREGDLPLLLIKSPVRLGPHPYDLFNIVGGGLVTKSCPALVTSWTIAC